MGQPLPYVCASPSCDVVRSSTGDGIFFDVQQLFSKNVGTQPQVSFGGLTHFINSSVLLMSTLIASG